MFNCRMCANTPFGAFFGYSDETTHSGQSTRRKARDVTSRLSRTEGSESSELVIQRATSEERMRFRPRSPEEVLTKVRAWEGYIHKRGHEFWGDNSTLQNILMTVAQSVDKHGDPILGDIKECIFWHGDVNETDSYPIIRMLKPGESTESQTYVTRILVFLYADDSSFAELQSKPSGAFPMICAETSCVNLSHIAID